MVSLALMAFFRLVVVSSSDAGANFIIIISFNYLKYGKLVQDDNMKIFTAHYL